MYLQKIQNSINDNNFKKSFQLKSNKVINFLKFVLLGIYSISFLTNGTFANNGNFNLEGVNFNVDQTIVGGGNGSGGNNQSGNDGNDGGGKNNGGEDNKNIDEIIKDSTKEGGEIQITKNMRKAVEIEYSKQTGSGTEMYLLDNNNNGKMDLVQINHGVNIMEGRGGITVDQFIVKEYNDRTGLFNQIYLNQGRFFVSKFFKDGKLFHISDQNNAYQAQQFGNRQLMYIGSNEWKNRGANENTFSRNIKYYYGIYNFKPIKQIISWDGLSNDGNYYYISGLGQVEDVLNNNELIGSLPGGTSNPQSLQTNPNISVQIGRNEDNTLSYRILEGSNYIGNFENVHGLYNIKDFQKNGKTDLITFENFKTKDGISFQKLYFYSFDGNEYQQIFSIDSKYITGFLSGTEKFISVKRIDGKAYLYQYNQEENTYKQVGNVKGDTFDIIDSFDKKLLVSKKIIFKSSGIGNISVFDISNGRFNKITEGDGIVANDFISMQYDEKSINTKGIIFGFRKSDKYKIYTFDGKSGILRKVENGRDNSGYLINSNEEFIKDNRNSFLQGKNRNRFVCINKLCGTTIGEGGSYELIYQDDDGVFKKTTQAFKTLVAKNFDRILWDTRFERYRFTSYVHEGLNLLHDYGLGKCDTSMGRNITNCYINNNREEFMDNLPYQDIIHGMVDDGNVLSNGDIFIGKNNSGKIEGGYTIFHEKNLFREGGFVSINYKGINQMLGNLYIHTVYRGSGVLSKHQEGMIMSVYGIGNRGEIFYEKNLGGIEEEFYKKIEVYQERRNAERREEETYYTGKYAIGSLGLYFHNNNINIPELQTLTTSRGRNSDKYFSDFQDKYMSVGLIQHLCTKNGIRVGQGRDRRLTDNTFINVPGLLTFEKDGYRAGRRDRQYIYLGKFGERNNGGLKLYDIYKEVCGFNDKIVNNNVIVKRNYELTQD